MQLQEACVGEAPLPADAETVGLVGVLGGMGPLATVDFLRKMLDATPAVADQDHVPVVVSSIPQVPDRTLAFRGEGASPLAAMVSSARRLVAAGAGLLVVPCNTAHLWYDEIHDAVGLPMLHIVDSAIEDAAAQAGPAARIGLLATDATLASGLYVNRQAGAARGVHWLLPTAGEMLDWVMPGVAAVKAGQLHDGAALLLKAVSALERRGAAAIVLGCTEIPVVLRPADSPLPLIDATAVLARRAVAWSLAQRRHAPGTAA
ncbi:aspartate/glutamate racemase family protein [Piscinibacter sp. HJYY11]|uniref:aspartate/glutamate racemase family protein n=1 Tax=Piscinibacter sp. HJYY11 TaxID=2801333 RepID=UPI00191CCE7F|nr:amino acid racemase [Piscinibacter sp. HJYY11]MBL0727968.1 amino acid racemase [Piscinibacter sp. HJYY11]